MVTDLYTLIEIILGVMAVFAGLSQLINKNALRSFLDLFLSDDRIHKTISNYIVANVLLLGVIIVTTHNDWYLGFSLITTLIGWVIIIKSSLWIFFNSFIRALGRKYKDIILHTWIHRSYGLFAIALGITMLWNHISFPI